LAANGLTEGNAFFRGGKISLKWIGNPKFKGQQDVILEVEKGKISQSV